MRAAVLHERGAQGLRVCDFPMPERQPGEILMRVRAAGLNRVDLYMRDDGAGITHQLPLILGVEGSGEIVEADPESGFTPNSKAVLYAAAFCGRCRYCLAGDQPLCQKVRIAGEHEHGAFAEYISRPARCFLPLPDAADLAEAATLPAAYLTAWRMLFGKRQLRPGQTVLIVGIGGGVGVACLQMARMAGARAIVTSSSDKKLKRAIDLGASYGVNYQTEPVSRRVLSLTDGEGVDMVIDSVGEASWNDSLRSLRRGGCIITCGATTGASPSADLKRVFIRQLEIIGSTSGSFDEFREVVDQFAGGRLRPVIDRRFPLDDIDSALAYLQRGAQFGKVVITV
jgi:NADPH:quinone reductase-like Zn-dependent oxidoreductase